MYEGEQFACQSTIETFVWTTDTVWSMHIIITIIIDITIIIIITTITIGLTIITKKIYIVLILSCDVDFENWHNKSDIWLSQENIVLVPSWYVISEN